MDHWAQSMAAAVKQSESLDADCKGAIIDVAAPEPTQFTYQTQRNRAFTDEARQKWQQRSIACLNALTKAGDILDKMIALADKYPQLHLNSEEFKNNKAKLDLGKSVIQKNIYKTGPTD